jgi:tetratricopeptide (TPR) repeat protein
MPFAMRRRVPTVTALLVISLLSMLPPASLPETAPADQEMPAPEGWAALQSGEPAKAASIFREALDRSPMNPKLHFGAGYAAYLLGRHDSAIYALKKALEYDPRFAQAAALLGEVAYARGDLELAIRSTEKALTLKPGDAEMKARLDRWRGESAVHAKLDARPGARFNVLFEGTTQKAIGARVALVLETAYLRVGKALNSYPSEALTVVLYTDQQFQDITRGPAWAGGQFDGRIRLAVGGALASPRALDRVVTHEFVHAAIASLAARNVPTWVHEGLASLFESTDQTWVTTVLSLTKGRIQLEHLEGTFSRFDSSTAIVAYAESTVAAQVLVERLGPNLGVFLQMLGTGHTVDQALSTLNVRPEAFHAEWRRRIGIRQ